MFNGPLRLRRQPNFKEKVEITKGDHFSVQVGGETAAEGVAVGRWEGAAICKNVKTADNPRRTEIVDLSSGGDILCTPTHT